MYPALTLALGAATMGAKVTVYCTMSGLDVVKKDAVKQIVMPGMPPVEKFVKDAIEAGVEICACAPSLEMLRQMGVTEATALPGVKLEDVVSFLREALPAAKEGGVVTFI